MNPILKVSKKNMMMMQIKNILSQLLIHLMPLFSVLVDRISLVGKILLKRQKISFRDRVCGTGLYEYENEC